MLSVPPLLGIGMVVDAAILVGGLTADVWTYKKEQTDIYEDKAIEEEGAWGEGSFSTRGTRIRSH